MSNGSTPEDNRTFAEILKRDPESLKCFECGYDNAPWAIATHGIFVCLDCSGQFRSLGVHLCFVRSSTMDGWSNWKPEKLLLMKAGGNAKCRRFFEAKGVPSSNLSSVGGGVPLREKFSHKYAMMYKDKLQAEADGQQFNEATWNPPEWWGQEQENISRRKEDQMRGGGVPTRTVTGQNKYEGFGSHPQGQLRGSQQQQNSAADDFLGYLGSAASRVAETTSYYAKEASDRTKKMYEEVESQEFSSNAKKSAEAVSEAATSAWGTLSSWTTTGFTALSAMASQGVETIRKELDGDESSNQNKNTTNGHRRLNTNDDDEDDNNGGGGLGGLTRNIRPSQQDYGHAEHSKVENNFTPYGSPQTNNDKNTTTIQKKTFSPTTSASPSMNNNNVENSTASSTTPIHTISSGPKPVVAAAIPAKKTFSPSVKKTTTTTAPSLAPTTTSENSGNKKAIPQDWGWDE